MSWKPKISKEEFIRRYSERSGMSLGKFTELDMGAYPCTCDYEKCLGWQMVGNELADELLREAMIQEEEGQQ